MGHTIPMSTSIARGSVCAKKTDRRNGDFPRGQGASDRSDRYRKRETDLDGHFTLEVDPDAKFIIVDYIGMKQTQVPIPKSGILNVALQPEAMNLDEVVVTGYGNFSRSSFTGSANTLRADLLKEMPVVSIEQKLQGMTSGVNITGSSVVWARSTHRTNLCL